MKLRLLLSLIILPSALAVSQLEFIVNSLQDSTQRDPQIERDSTGNFVVVWQSFNHATDSSLGDIVMRRFAGNVIREEVLVNTIVGGNQEKPAMAMNGTGTFVVAWASVTNRDSSYDIKARLYKTASPEGPEFLVNTTWPSAQTEPDVAIDSAGNFVIVWDSWDQDRGGDRGVYGRVFAPDGTPRTGEFQVNFQTWYSQARPAVKYLPDGRFVVVWESWMQDEAAPAGYGVYGRLFNATGTPASSEFQVNTFTRNNQWYADVETFRDGSFIVVWCSWEQDGGEGGIVAQRFNSAGQRIGGEFIVNRTTVNYQWLPRIRRFDDDGFVVVWSSWKQDGSREGVYARKYGPGGGHPSFEVQVNTYTTSYQWEPDVIPFGKDDLLAVWSSWGQTGKDYDIVARRVTIPLEQGYFSPGVYGHPVGRSTTRVLVHVLDSLALTGHAYEAVFDSLGGGAARVRVRDVTTGDTVVAGYPIDRGENVFYVTPAFHGVALEVIPEFDLDLDFTRSYMVNRSGTTMTFTVGYPSAGLRLVAPIDIALIWGKTDTLATGAYVTPLDTALTTQGGKSIGTPFRAWNLTDNQKVDLLVIEGSNVKNQRWDPGERIVFLTPVQYRTVSNNTHAELVNPDPVGSYIRPGPGDTNYIFSTRPIRQGEKFTFSTPRSAILGVNDRIQDDLSYALHQNFPNPFNPTTVVSYQLPMAGEVSLAVYDLLGREVAVLESGRQSAGRHRVQFDGRGMASGVYFARLVAAGRTLVQKMMMVR